MVGFFAGKTEELESSKSLIGCVVVAVVVVASLALLLPLWTLLLPLLFLLLLWSCEAPLLRPIIRPEEGENSELELSEEMEVECK